jgi:acetyl-CoA synthetase
MSQPTSSSNQDAVAFLATRDFLLRHRNDYETAVREFRWPSLTRFNWALDYFDSMAAGNDRPALHIVEEDGSECVRSFAQLSRRPRRRRAAVSTTLATSRPVTQTAISRT